MVLNRGRKMTLTINKYTVPGRMELLLVGIWFREKEWYLGRPENCSDL